MKNMNKRNVGFAFIVLGVLLFLTLISGVFSISYLVNDAPHVSYSATPDIAMDRCEDDRQDFISQGKDCDACALSCPPGVQSVSGGVYSYEYSGSSIYFGSWDDLECDYIGRGNSVSDHVTDTPDAYFPNGAVMQVQSYCHDRIRVCNKPVGSQTLIDTYDVYKGDIYKYSQLYAFGPCDGTDTVFGSTSNEIKYRLVCDSGYYVDGDDFDGDRSDLGDCVSTTTSNDDVDTPNRGGVISDIRIGSEYVVGEQISVRGKFEATADGTYLLGVDLDDSPSSQALAVVTGSATFDQCSNDVGAASNFFTLNEGDIVVFSMVIQAPDVPGVYSVGVYATESCTVLNVYDQAVVETTIVEDAHFEVVGSSNVVTGDVDEGAEDDLIDSLSEGAEDIFEESEEQGGCEGVDLSVDGCVIAECVDNVPVILDEVRCYAEPIIDGVDPSTYGSDDYFVVNGNEIQDNLALDNESLAERVTGSGRVVSIISGLLILVGVILLFINKKKK